MTIGFNKYQFYGKLIILTIVLTFASLFAYYRPLIKFQPAPIGGIIFEIIIFSFLTFLLILMTLQLIFLPKGVEIDQQSKILTLKFLFATSLTLSATDITEFCTIRISTKSETYDNLLISTQNGKEFILGNFNLKDFKPIQLFLEEANVPFTGHFKKFGFVAYFAKNFRN